MVPVKVLAVNLFTYLKLFKHQLVLVVTSETYAKCVTQSAYHLSNPEVVFFCECVDIHYTVLKQIDLLKVKLSSPGEEPGPANLAPETKPGPSPPAIMLVSTTTTVPKVPIMVIVEPFIAIEDNALALTAEDSFTTVPLKVVRL